MHAVDFVLDGGHDLWWSRNNTLLEHQWLRPTSGKEIILGAPPDGGSTYNCDSCYQYTICN